MEINIDPVTKEPRPLLHLNTPIHVKNYYNWAFRLNIYCNSTSLLSREISFEGMKKSYLCSTMALFYRSNPEMAELTRLLMVEP